IQYDYIYYLYKISTDNSTLCIWEWSYDGTGYVMTETAFDMLRLERERMMDMFSDYLLSHFEPIIQTEATQIKSEAKKLWKVVTNWKIFKKIAPLICDECEYEGDLTQID